MGNHDEQELDNYKDSHATFYRIYVDETFSQMSFLRVREWTVWSDSIVTATVI